jgi:transcriptional regulator with XRE-family HTH domain
MSQRDLAAKANVDPAASRLEQGKESMSITALTRIADALDVSLGVLFADTVMVEAAALQLRRIPVLTPVFLKEWKGGGSLEFPEDFDFLYGDLRRFSRHVFALRVLDDANLPRFERSDELIFDSSRSPQLGSIVAAQDGNGQVFIGRYRVSPGANYAVVPYDPQLYPTATPGTHPGLRLCGSLVEHRRYVP